MAQYFQTLSDLALFVEVGRTGSFRLAAARLSVPASTLSRRIAAMEARLGLRLLLRTTRQVKLAPGAQAYFTQCEQVVDAAERAQAALELTRQGPSRLRLSMPVDLGVEILGPIVASFAAGQAGLAVEMDLSSRASDLLRDPVDLVFRVGKPLDDRVVARRIAEIGAGLYASPSLLRRVGSPVDPVELPRLPCLNLLTAAGPMPWRVGNQRWPQAPGPHALSANSVSLLRTLAERGYGIALLPEHIATASVLARRLVQVLPQATVPGWPLYAITATRAVPARVRALIDHVREALRQGPLAVTP